MVGAVDFTERFRTPRVGVDYSRFASHISRGRLT